jgi:hypothetical protein
VTSYLAELDTTETFGPSSDTYVSRELSLEYEVQQTVAHFRSEGDARSRGGTFTLERGGRRISDTPFAISASEVDAPLTRLLELHQNAMPPVTVTVPSSLCNTSAHQSVGSLMHKQRADRIAARTSAASVRILRVNVKAAH